MLHSVGKAYPALVSALKHGLCMRGPLPGFAGPATYCCEMLRAGRSVLPKFGLVREVAPIRDNDLREPEHGGRVVDIEFAAEAHFRNGRN